VFGPAHTSKARLSLSGPVHEKVIPADRADAARARPAAGEPAALDVLRETQEELHRRALDPHRVLDADHDAVRMLSQMRGGPKK